MHADPQRFLHRFAEHGEFGRTAGGGIDRQAATASDLHVRTWLQEVLEMHGASVHYDVVGNQFGLFEFVPGAAWILTGSHLDSQPLGGRYDGSYGVIASAEAAIRIAESVTSKQVAPTVNLAVVNWFNEEGSRFPLSMMGSSVFTGKFPLADALAVEDAAGISVRDALSHPAGAGTFSPPPVSGYVEIHVEQSRHLDRSGIGIGLVDRTWAARKYVVRVLGEQSHSGATAMADRHDALVGAAGLVTAVREAATLLQDDSLHASVPQLTVLPNSPVVVPREVVMTVDLRAVDIRTVEKAHRLLLDAIDEVVQAGEVAVEWTVTHSWESRPYHQEGVELAERSARALGLPAVRMQTVAGHDSTNMKDVVPTIMLFVPSVDGIAHNEGEFTRDEDLSAGVDLVTEVLSALVEGHPFASHSFTPYTSR